MLHQCKAEKRSLQGLSYFLYHHLINELGNKQWEFIITGKKTVNLST